MILFAVSYKIDVVHSCLYHGHFAIFNIFNWDTLVTTKYILIQNFVAVMSLQQDVNSINTLGYLNLINSYPNHPIASLPTGSQALIENFKSKYFTDHS